MATLVRFIDISAIDLNLLNYPITMEEVHRAVFYMDLFKALEVDDLHVGFY